MAPRYVHAPDRDDIDYDKIERKKAYDYVFGPLFEAEPSQLAAAHVAQPARSPDSSTSDKDLPPTPDRSVSENTTPASSPASPRPRFFPRLSQNSIQEDRDEVNEHQSSFAQFIRRNSSRRVSRHSSAASRTKNPQPTQQELDSLVYTLEPAKTSWNQGTILARANSVATSKPTAHQRNTMVPPRDTRHRRGHSMSGGQPLQSNNPFEPHSRSNNTSTPRRGVSLRDPGPVAEPSSNHLDPHSPTAAGKLPRRERSLRERYPGDMSHRPLDLLKEQNRAADRAPHLHTHRRQQPSDTIDSLDNAGPKYHHSGPFDPVLAARNTDPRYAPLEAVKDSNLDAIKATPPDFLADSLAKHVPLQGTATVPPGMADLGGRTMNYPEGADLMREADAAGGPYRRWEGRQYLDEDLKGKGEPSYTYEKQLKEKKMRAKEEREMGGIEMQPRSTGFDVGPPVPSKDAVGVRHRNVKPLPSPPAGEAGPRDDPFADEYAVAGGSGSGAGLKRKGIVGSIKRRIGGLRRK